MRYSTTGQLLSSTFLGTPDYDQCFLVQLDTQDGVYVIGQTHGAYPVTPGKYTNAGSSQFIHKLSSDLSTSAWSTVIGNGQGDKCEAVCLRDHNSILMFERRTGTEV